MRTLILKVACLEAHRNLIVIIILFLFSSSSSSSSSPAVVFSLVRRIIRSHQQRFSSILQFTAAIPKPGGLHPPLSFRNNDRQGRWESAVRAVQTTDVAGYRSLKHKSIARLYTRPVHLYRAGLNSLLLLVLFIRDYIHQFFFFFF